MPGEQLRQRGLALQRAGRRVRSAAVEMQEVEQVVAQAVAAAGAEVGLQLGEAGRALLGLHHHLPVEQAVTTGSASSAFLSVGNLVVQSSPLRVRSFTRPRSMRAIRR